MEVTYADRVDRSRDIIYDEVGCQREGEREVGGVCVCVRVCGGLDLSTSGRFKFLIRKYAENRLRR